MIQRCKICGISDSKTLEFLTTHPNPPEMIGFICNWPKSKRFVEFDKLKKLLKVDKKKSEYVAVLVKPDNEILEKHIKKNRDVRYGRNLKKKKEQSIFEF